MSGRVSYKLPGPDRNMLIATNDERERLTPGSKVWRVSRDDTRILRQVRDKSGILDLPISYGATVDRMLKDYDYVDEWTNVPAKEFHDGNVFIHPKDTDTLRIQNFVFNRVPAPGKWVVSSYDGRYAVARLETLQEGFVEYEDSTGYTDFSTGIFHSEWTAKIWWEHERFWKQREAMLDAWSKEGTFV